MSIAKKIDSLTAIFRGFDNTDSYSNPKEFYNHFENCINYYLMHCKEAKELLELVSSVENEDLRRTINQHINQLYGIYFFKINVTILQSRGLKDKVIKVLNEHSESLIKLEGSELELATCLEIVKKLPKIPFNAHLCQFIEISIQNNLYKHEEESIDNLSTLFQLTLEEVTKEPKIKLNDHQRDIIAVFRTQLKSFITILEALKTQGNTKILKNKLLILALDCFGNDLAGIQQLKFLTIDLQSLQKNIIDASFTKYFTEESKVENTSALLDQLSIMAKNEISDLTDINKLILRLELFRVQYNLSSSCLVYFFQDQDLNKKDFLIHMINTTIKENLLPEEIKEEVTEKIKQIDTIKGFDSGKFNKTLNKHISEARKDNTKMSLKDTLLNLDLSLSENEIHYAKQLISNLEKVIDEENSKESISSNKRKGKSKGKKKGKSKSQKEKQREAQIEKSGDIKSTLNWKSLSNRLDQKITFLNESGLTSSEENILAKILLERMKELDTQQQQQTQKIQRNVRKHLAKKKLLALKTFKRDQASIKIQSLSRQYSAKKRVKYLKQEKSAIKIQTIIRQYHAMQKSKLIKQETSATKIQTNMKLWLSKNLAHSLKPLLALKSHINSRAAELKIEDTAANLNSAIKNYISIITENPSLKTNPIIKELMPKCLESHERFLSLCEDQTDYTFETVHLLHLLRSVNSYFNTKEIISADEVLRHKHINLSKQDTFINNKILTEKKEFLVSELRKSAPYLDSPEKILYIDWLNKSLFKLRQLHTHYMHPRY